MAVFDPVDVVRKTFLLGVGFVATGAEKSQEIVSDLVKKGELTVEQGKALNEELTRKASATMSDSEDTLLRARLRTMSAEDRAAYARKVAEAAAAVDAEEAKEAKGEAESVDAEDEPVEPDSAE